MLELPIEEDFVIAAKYRCAMMVGGSFDNELQELKRRYTEDEDLDALVHLFAQHRKPLDNYATVPLEPISDMTDNLATHLIKHMCGEIGKITPRRLFGHLEILGVTIPQWLKDEPGLKDLDKVPDVITRATIVYKAMVYGFLNRDSI